MRRGNEPDSRLNPVVSHREEGSSDFEGGLSPQLRLTRVGSRTRASMMSSQQRAARSKEAGMSETASPKRARRVVGLPALAVAVTLAAAA